MSAMLFSSLSSAEVLGEFKTVKGSTGLEDKEVRAQRQDVLYRFFSHHWGWGYWF